MNMTGTENELEKKTDTEKKPQKRSGGLYSKVNISVKTADILIVILVAALAAVMIFVVSHNGFTVKFETDGGSQIESVKVMHSHTVPIEETPVKEGYVFTGWYTDSACTNEWDLEVDTVEQSMTLYAGWKKK